MALDASSLRKIVYKTVEDSTTLAAGVTQAKLVEFSAGGFAADIFVEAGIYKFSVEISSEERYAFSMIDFGAGTDKFYVAANGTSVYLKRTDASDVAKDIGSIIVRKGIRFGEISNAVITSDSTPGLTWRQIDKTYSTQLESLTVDGNFNLRSDLDVNGGDITTTQTTFNLINTNAATLNIGGEATSLNLAAASGTVNINSTVNSTNTTSGALVVDGGIGVANNAYIGSNATVLGVVGIGRANELGYKFEVYKSDTSITQIDGGRIIVTSDNPSAPALQVSNSGTGSIVDFVDGSNSAFAVLDGGSVGIGTNAPLNKLEIRVSGADSDEGIIITRGDATVTTDEILGGIGFDSTDGNRPSSVLEASAFIAAYAAEDHSVGDKGGYLVFGTAPIDQDDDTPSIERVRIAADGKVGIGTSSPSEMLDITGNAKISGDLAVNGGDITTTSTTMNIGYTGSIGQTINIGTAEPGANQTNTINIGYVGSSSTGTNRAININFGNNVTTVSIPGDLVVAGDMNTAGTGEYENFLVKGQFVQGLFPFMIVDDKGTETAGDDVEIFRVGYNGSTYIGGNTQISGSLTVDGASFSIYSTSSSNATVIGSSPDASNLTLAAGNSSSGTADVLISAKSEIDLDANAIDLNSDTSVTIDGADFSINGEESSNITLTGNSGSAVNLTISSTNSGASTANVLISAEEEVDITSGSIDVNVTTGTIDGAITLTGSLAADNLLLDGTEISTTEDTITINPNSDGAANTGTVIITGNLQVEGTTTTINTTDLLVSDNTITLNSNYTGSSPSVNAGIEIERGTLDNASLVWNEGSDKWQFNDGTTTFDFVKNTDLPTGFSITAGSTDGIFDITGTGGTNSVSYSVAPYGTKTVGGFDDGSTNPDGTTRLNWNGYLYATKLYSGGNEVYTSANLPAYPTGFSISAGSTDGIFDITGTGGTNSVSYAIAPYSSKQPSGVHFYTGSAAAPSNTDRLNLDAALHATSLHSNGYEVLTTNDLAASGAVDLDAVTTAGNSTANSITVGGLTVGSGSGDGTVQSNGNYDLIVKTGNATTGSITIADGSNGDITIASNGTGAAVFSNTTDASSSTVASVEVAGGVAIAKKLFVGTDLSVGGTVTLTNDLDVTHGGTGVSSFTSNGVLYGNAGNDILVTAAGSVGDVLAVTSSAPTWRRVMKHYTNTSSDLTFGNGAGGGWIASTSHTVTDLAPNKYYYIRFVGAYDKNAAGGTAAKVGMSCAITGGTGMAVNGKLYIKKDSGDGADEVVSSLTTATSAGDAANTVETPEEVTAYSDLPLGMEAILYTGTSGTVTVTMNFRHPFGATSGWFIRINRHSALVVTELV